MAEVVILRRQVVVRPTQQMTHQMRLISSCHLRFYLSFLRYGDEDKSECTRLIIIIHSNYYVPEEIFEVEHSVLD